MATPYAAPEGRIAFKSGGTNTAAPRRAAHRDRSRNRRLGQSLVEFGLILPVLLTLVGVAVDMARVYGARITLEAATRDAAEQVASGGASTAQYIVCTETVNLPGFVAPVGNPGACTSPTVTVTYSTSTSASVGGSTAYPVGTATVTATLPFHMLFPYPLFTQGGNWNLSSTQSYSVVQNR